MERYHIYKLGIAILFYAIYNRRPIMAGALSTQQNGNGDEFVYYQGVQGKPGIDFPVYARIPRTSFNCKKVESGYYADLETNCQVFHICNGGAKISFLCPNGTIFQQSDLICEWWFKVNCTNSPNFYSESAEQLREGSWNRKDNRKSGRNRNTSSKSTLESNDVRRNEIVNGFNNKLHEEHKDTNILDSRTEQIYEPSRSEIEELRKKQANGDRGGRKFKQKNYNNINVRNELTESDVTNSDEAQVPQETASFYKNNQNTIQSFDKPTTNRYPNHKETYSEIQQPKFYSTKAINTFSQTIPPQTFSTNRIPLNEGKPFIVSTPKSAYNIQFSGISNNPNEFNRATTESFRYSPTVPPFTTRKSQSTTVIPKIIVDLDAGSEVSDRNYNNGFSSSVQSYYNQPTQSNKNPNNKPEYTTPHAITTSGDRKGISFAEKINTFSGLEGIIHTPTTKYDNFKVKIDSVSTSNVNNAVNGGHETSTINSYNPSTISSSDKYNVNSKSNLKSHSFSNNYETTTKDSYFPSIIVATSVKYGVDSDVGTNHTLITSSNLPKTTESNYYHYNSDTQNNSEENKHHTTIEDSYYPVAVNSPAASYDGSIFNNSQFGVAQHNPVYTIQESKNDVSVNGLFSNTTKANNGLQNYPPSVYADGNREKSVVASRNTNNNNRNSIPDNSFSGKELFVNSATTTGPSSRSNEQSENKQISEVVQHNNKVTENNKENPINTKEQVEPQSSYGDACEDDIVYAELPPDQIIIGKPRIVIDDTTVPTTEKDIVKITVNNANPTVAKLPPDSEKATSKSVTDSTIFRINVKYGQQTGSTNKPNGFYVTRQFDENNEQLTSQLSTTFFNKNTYLPKKTSYLTSTENYSQTRPHTYLPKRPTPAPFSINRPNIDLLNNKNILEESSGFPQSVNTRENHLKTSAGVPQISEDIQQQFALKPKPFELPPKESIEEIVSVVRNSESITSAPLPDYKVSSARPFSIGPGNYEENTIYPTLATPFSTRNNKISEHLQSMLNTLNEIINERNSKSNGTDSPRPGLVIPPSVGPQTLHTLAVYFANALDGISSENGDQLPNIDESQAINQLLTHSTINRYRELFKGENDPVVTTLVPEVETDESNDLEGQHSKTAVTPRVRQLAQVFTKALSSYLDDPDMFKKVLEEARPTEPPVSNNNGKGYGVDDDELLNYSDADIKPNLPRLSTTTAAPIPTWAYILAPNNSNSYDYNTLNVDGEHLQSSDSQSFASQFNNYIKDKHFNKGTPNTTPLIQTDKQNLPSNHWTSSVNATKLWQDKLYTNPQAINEDLNVPTIVSDSREGGAIESNESSESNVPPVYTGINYSVTNLPKMELNSSQVDKILVDIVNSSSNDGNKLKRILHKLNTTQEDFLAKMREIEQNPLTRRLILLLISECGSNITHLENPSESGVQSSTSNTSNKQTDLFESSRAAEQNKFRKGSSPFPVYVDPSLKDEDEDNRALQLLNSLYTIAAKYGK